MRSLLAHRRQFLVYLAGGVLSAVVDVGVLQMMLSAGTVAGAAVSAGFAAGLLVNYLFHLRVTFGGSAESGNFVRYLCVVGLNYVLTLGCVALGVKLGAGVLVGKLVALPLVALNGFVLGKLWIFRS
ncbi:GtrA family protein [Massilia arenosa]|uniref:GtrA family protein n=1 Tax=Zemynaea arenosa TaxID=2561931 RepID=A0A4Y9T036_9BURK|nr:GtrA family protein [Massilia arenosa]TFW30253.1 GtrA family protein [Massilia arenosa]